MLRPPLFPNGQRTSNKLYTFFSVFMIFALLGFLPAQVQSGLVKAADHAKSVPSLTLPFIPNAGQASAEALFTAQDLHGAVALTASGPVLDLPGLTTPMQVLYQKANPAPELKGGSLAAMRVNYLLGSDPSHWVKNLATYTDVTYHSLYSGVDLTYTLHSGTLKGTFTVAPEADPAQIRWSYAGASPSLAPATGDLLIDAGIAKLTEKAPLAWQIVNGSPVIVPVGYHVYPDGSIGFNLGAYQANLALIIDPSLVYSSYLGGSGLDSVDAVAVDDTGIYVAGTTTSTSIASGITPKIARATAQDAFVMKLNPAGSEAIYLTYLGGSDDDNAVSLALGADQSIYLLGESDSTDFPTHNGVQSTCTQMGGACWGDIFALHLNPAGDTLLYSTLLGGGAGELAEGAALGPNGWLYLTGTTYSENFPTKAAIQSTMKGDSDAFVAAIDPTKTGAASLVFSTYLGGTGDETGGGIAVAPSGSVYLTGSTFSADFPVKDPLQLHRAGPVDAFLVRMNAAGTALEKGTYFGGTGEDYGYALAANATHVCVTGQTLSADLPMKNAAQTTLKGAKDAMLACLDSDLAALQVSTYLGGTKDEGGYALALSTDKVYVAGTTASSDFPLVNAILSPSGAEDGFVSRLDLPAGTLGFSTCLGGSSTDGIAGLALASDGKILVGGSTLSTNLPTQAPFQAQAGGKLDGWIALLSDDGQGNEPPGPVVNPLAGSTKTADKTSAAGGDTVMYTLTLHNSSTTDVKANVVDTLPIELTLTEASVTPAGVFNAAARTLTWTDISVPAGADTLLTYSMTVKPDLKSVAVNTAAITIGDTTIDRSATVMITPLPVTTDHTLPKVTSLVIGDADFITDPNTTLHISASDDTGLDSMYVVEWSFATLPWPHWEMVKSSGWLPFSDTLPWKLSEHTGVHYVGVWVKDQASNISILTLKALDYASLVLPGSTFSWIGLEPFLLSYTSGTPVQIDLSVASGPARIYVWYPGNFGIPDKISPAGGSTSQVTFTAPRDGTYILLISGTAGKEYTLTVTPKGGPAPIFLTGSSAQASSDLAGSAASDLTGEPFFSKGNLDPMGSAVQPPSYQVWLPIISRSR
jgi:uncharacterized repeat protein (TIGR01451 family)